MWRAARPFRKIIFRRGDSEDAESRAGRPFSMAFETGLDDLREITHCALTTFADRNILYLLEFPSALKLEEDIVDVAGKN